MELYVVIMWNVCKSFR